MRHLLHLFPLQAHTVCERAEIIKALRGHSLEESQLVLSVSRPLLSFITTRRYLGLLERFVCIQAAGMKGMYQLGTDTGYRAGGQSGMTNIWPSKELLVWDTESQIVDHRNWAQALLFVSKTSLLTRLQTFLLNLDSKSFSIRFCHPWVFKCSGFYVLFICFNAGVFMYYVILVIFLYLSYLFVVNCLEAAIWPQ